MTDIVKKARIGKEELRIIVDDNPESPREWDNLGTMVCFHRRYNFPKEEIFESPEDLEKFLQINKVVVLPLYLFDHSGLTMQTYPFEGLYAHFDSGKLGYIYVTYENIRKELKVKKITQKVIRKVEETLKQEVKVFSQFLSGDVYGYELVKLETCNLGEEHEEIQDSCFGFYGDNIQENGMLDHVDKKWKNAQFE